MEIVRTLAVLAERPTAEHGRLAQLLEFSSTPAEDAWTRLFLFELFPYASVHLGPEGMLGGEARDRVAGFMRALEATPPPEPDHVPVLLAAYAELRDRAAGDEGSRAAHAARTLLHEHLLSWLPLWLARVTDRGPSPYDEWASLVGAALRAEVEAHAPEPELLSQHLRSAPGLDDPRRPVVDGGEHDRRDDGPGRALVAQLLVPVRTGTVVTIGDLRDAASDLDLAGRIGERRYVLEQLLGQDAARVLRWLAGHTVRTTGHAWAPWRALLPATAGWWIDRATATATLLEELADEAETAEVVTPA